MDVELIAYFAAFFKSCACFPQALRVLKTGQTKGMSLTTYVMLTIGIVMWLIYGLYNQLLPLIIASSLSAALNFAILQAVFKSRLPRFRAFKRLKTKKRRRLSH